VGKENLIKTVKNKISFIQKMTLKNQISFSCSKDLAQTPHIVRRRLEKFVSEMPFLNLTSEINKNKPINIFTFLVLQIDHLWTKVLTNIFFRAGVGIDKTS